MTIGIATAVSNFNPRTHVGCDGTETERMRAIKDFNPRTHVGCDWLQ